jgi:hypothetical protein
VRNPAGRRGRGARTRSTRPRLPQPAPERRRLPPRTSWRVTLLPPRRTSCGLIATGTVPELRRLMRADLPLGQHIPGMRGLLTTFLGFTSGLIGCLGPLLAPYTLPAGQSLPFPMFYATAGIPACDQICGCGSGAVAREPRPRSVTWVTATTIPRASCVDLGCRSCASGRVGPRARPCGPEPDGPAHADAGAPLRCCRTRECAEF